MLGTCYNGGFGVAQDYAEALRWHRLAAAQGHAAAQCNLGGMLGNRDGVAQDYAESVRWYRLAAAQGDVQAQLYLGVIFEEGQGVAQDCTEAVRWYRLAAAQGHPCAATALMRLGTIHCMDGDCPQTAVLMDKNVQDLCNTRFAAGCSMIQSPNDVGRVHSSVKSLTRV